MAVHEIYKSKCVDWESDISIDPGCLISSIKRKHSFIWLSNQWINGYIVLWGPSMVSDTCRTEEPASGSIVKMTKMEHFKKEVDSST
ncbi:hypothetical protein NQ317_001549 [Molorchus minor]|uniref:Uncharacterized protein n=1 Tax=Molorchus minor TaxID=1323400 RepID=A0ABQ9J331_9CUCU|nr:hypothetical protein NQ317_001549 [Molorchus minor]